jgi:SAM-dependent methyltransferase
MRNGKIVETRKLDPEEQSSLLGSLQGDLSSAETQIGCVLEHARVPFVSYPFEWAPEMLHAAGELTLELARTLLSEGIGIKDATPYNVLFSGPRAVFVDFLSFEKRPPLDPIWRADAQFSSSFLNPLLVNKYFGIPMDLLLLNRRNGIAPQEVYSLCGPLRRWRPPFLGLVTLPTLLSSNRRANDPGVYRPHLSSSPEKAAFVLGALLSRKERTLKAMSPEEERSSFWSGYMDGGFPHTPGQLSQKEAFVASTLGELAPKRVLDVGCNTGHFSRIAAKSGAKVVAIDSDPVAVGRTWRMATSERLDVLPLVVNLASPSPAVGWNNAESPSFLQRGQGFFDTVLMLAVIHHLIVSDGIPVREIVSLAAELTRDTLVIEFVGPADPAFQRMARGRDFSYLTESHFEHELHPRFHILRKERAVDGDRCLYCLRKKPSHA